MSKIETGKLELHPCEYDVPSLINDAIQLNIVRIGSKPIEFALDVEDNLPFKLYGSELRIKQILNNLLSNAIKYTDEGEVRLSVSHEITGNDEAVLKFSVADTGQGMKPEDKAQLFSEYTRFNSEANRTTEGTGLGLSITKKLVDMMSGTIVAESEYGKGSTFTFTVKQKIIDETPIGIEITENLRALNYSDHVTGERRKFVREIMPYGKVLIVDDVEINLFVAEGLLTPYKVETETALSGFEAIEKVQSGKKYDIIFMDHMMPKMDGLETTKRLRDSGYTGSIVALTANALVGHEELFLENGFDGFISKPIDVRLLNASLNKHIRDRYPEEAKKYKPNPESVTHESGEQKKLLMQVFCRDAEKAISVLNNFVITDNGDIKLFTTTAHAMKSALANIGEKKLSDKAYNLEKAGQSGDTAFIKSNATELIHALEALIKTLEPDEAAVDDSNVQEDTEFLEAQLAIIKTACDDYDADTAFAALDALKAKQWKNSTAAAIKEMYEALYLSSDFEAAAEMADKQLKIKA
jgi:CheY-like chemotaxis protein